MEIYNRLGTAPVPRKDFPYWRGTGQRYHASTEICTGSVLASLRSRLLADTWSQDWGCTLPVPRQPWPGTNCPVQALILVFNWRGTAPLVNTGMNPTFPPGELYLLCSSSTFFQRTYSRDVIKAMYAKKFFPFILFITLDDPLNNSNKEISLNSFQPSCLPLFRALKCVKTC